MPCYEPTDTGNAQRFAAAMGAQLRYVPAWRRWLRWDRYRWRDDDTHAALRATGELSRWIAAEASVEPDPKRRGLLLEWGLSCESHARRVACLTLAAAEAPLIVTPDQLDADPWALCTPSGIVDLRTGRCRPATPADLVTLATAAPFDIDAPSPLWDRTLRFAFWRRPAVLGYVHRALGSALVGAVREHHLHLAIGDGANAKTSVLGTVQHALGDYAATAAPDLLLASRDSRHPTELADLRARRLVLTHETGAGRSLNEDRVKQLTGGDKVKARRMREDFSEIAPTWHLWLISNHRPRIRGTDNGVWRRVALVEFLHTIPAEKRDHARIDRLKDEAAGVLGWLVRGCKWWQLGGLAPPKDVQAATEKYRIDEDQLGRCLEDVALLASNGWCSRPAIRAAYETWCERESERPMSARSLAEALRRRPGISEAKRDGVRGWCGVTLRAGTPLLDAAQEARHA